MSRGLGDVYKRQKLWIDVDSKNISKIIIDPKNEMADINRDNNHLVL